MFQYAAGWSLARHCGATLCVDKGPFQVYTKRPFHLDKLQIRAKVVSNENGPEAYSGAAWVTRFKQWSRTGRSGKAGKGAVADRYREPHFHFDPAFFECCPPVTVDGYFQSEAYFHAVADEVRDQFVPAVPMQPEHARLSEQIAGAESAISVHIRRGDYVDAPDVRRVHGVLDAAYYRRALQIMDGLLGGRSAIFLFSDDVDAALSMLDFVPAERVVPVRGDPHSPWDDMLLMARCRHHVIANSSFSWWGAWLDPRPNKIVVAPRRWFAAEELRRQNTCDLLPPQWIAI
jgi:hypothetical protein